MATCLVAADELKQRETKDEEPKRQTQPGNTVVLAAAAHPPTEVALSAQVMHLGAWPGMLFCYLLKASRIQARSLHGQRFSPATSVAWLMVTVAPSIATRAIVIR
ncbi:hypothetical protein HPB52_004518 [Rhipicephalus sanguineus]|uniref:Uncharacterized protein n=1 Tax=Rhipicephalus sanguineus TaxID=34632 RepID=A0A9D4SVL6_RHISA|nr:hypothetical protein HPB52_004518 [Rhipicephalus sanguineus]